MKLWIRSLLGIGLAALLMGSAATAVPASAALDKSTPAVGVTIQDNWAGREFVPARFRHEMNVYPQYTLHVTGTNFMPGATVKIAVIHTGTVQVLHQGTATVEPAAFFSWGTHSMVTNPRAGTFQYKADMNGVLPAESVHLWCKAADHMDFHEVVHL